MTEKSREDLLVELGIDPGTVQPIGEVSTSIQGWDLKHSDLIGNPIIVLSFESITTRIGPAYVARCVVGDEERRVLIGASVLMKQLDEIRDRLPVSATIQKPGKYYVFE